MLPARRTPVFPLAPTSRALVPRVIISEASSIVGRDIARFP
jgi:hypothetical protein